MIILVITAVLVSLANYIVTIYSRIEVMYICSCGSKSSNILSVFWIYCNYLDDYGLRLKQRDRLSFGFLCKHEGKCVERGISAVFDLTLDLEMFNYLV